MSKKFGAVSKFSSKFDLAKRFLEIYLSIFPPKDKLGIKAKEALAYFLTYGYSKEKEKNLQNSLSEKMKYNYVRVVINELKRNGYIVIDEENHQKRLSDPMINCREQLFKNNQRTFTIGFLKV